MNIFWNMIILSVISPLFYWLGVSNSLKWWKRRWYRARRRPRITQEQANKMSEPRKLDIATKYANTSLLLLTGFSYLFLFPFILIFVLIGTWLQYWVEKLILVKYSKIPRNIGPSLAKRFIKILPLIVCFHGVSTFYFWYRLTDDFGNSIMPVYVTFGVVFFLYLYFFIFEKQRHKSIPDKMESRVMKFIWKYNYTFCNPVTKAVGEIEVSLLEMLIHG